MPSTGVVVLGFGGPDSLEAVGPFIRNLTGREPSDDVVARMRTRYLAIGGASPLALIAGSIAERLSENLAKTGYDVPVAVGMRYWHPFIDDALASLKDQGCERVVTLSLSPFESKVASEAYRQAVTESARRLGLDVVEAPLVSALPDFAEYLAAATAYALTQIEPSEGAVIAFSAHSLPLADLLADDPYVAGLRQTAAHIAERLALAAGVEDAGAPLFETFRAFGTAEAPRPWFLVYQSKGERPGAWLEPELGQLIDACVAADVPAICVCPIGFVTDHMETLYDLDIVAADCALTAGIEFARAPVPNDDEGFVDAMADMVRGFL